MTLMTYLILALLVGLGMAIFAVSNGAPVDINFITWHFRASLGVMLLGSAAAGAVVIFLISTVRQIGNSLQAWDLQAKIRRLEGELKAKEQSLAKTDAELARVRQDLAKANEEITRLRTPADSGRTEATRHGQHG